MKSEKFWDMISKKFDERSSYFEQTYIKIFENARKYLNGGNIVLDCGCATGTVAIEIAGLVKEIHGIDISSRMIDAAKRKASERRIKNIDFAHATIFDERYKRESFDVILALNVLHLVEDPQKFMQRINELLKPGGLIISATGCLGERKTFFSFIIFALISLVTKIRIVPPMSFFKISELENLIVNGNFQIVKTEIFTHHPATEYFIAAKKILRK